MHRTLSKRPLTQDHRRDLERHLRSTLGRGEGVFAAVMAGSLALGLLLLAFERLIGRPGNALQALAVLMGFTLGAFFYRRITRQHWRGEQAALARRDLEEGDAVVERYRARRALRVDELEDEGSGFFLELDERHTLFLCGQYLYEADEEGRFPCGEFEIIRAPHSRLLLGLDCLAPPFPTMETLPPFDVDEIDEGSAPLDGEVLNESLEDILVSRRH